jgi:outer membrane receptor protein involved in Fe transport
MTVLNSALSDTMRIPIMLSLFTFCLYTGTFCSAQDSSLQKVTNLRAVTITGQKNRIEVKGSKITLNVQNSAVAAGGTAFDLLRQLPGVSIGQDDNIQLRGASGINVMIDGKMTYLSGKALVELLKGTSATNISKVELLLSPTAAFDAAGNAGIINIVNKKNAEKGYAIDLKTGISKGNRWMHNENVTASYRTGTFNISGSFDYNTPHRYLHNQSGNTIAENGKDIAIKRDYKAFVDVRFYTYKVAAEWQFLPRHQLSAGYHGYLDDFRMDKFSVIVKSDAAHQETGTVISKSYITEPYHYDAANIGYQYDIDSSGKKISADAHYISYRNYSDGLLTASYQDGSKDALRSSQPGFIKVRSVKADAELPYTFAAIKAGIKYSYVSNDNSYRFDSLLNNGFVEAATMSDHFLYKEKIYAAYLSAAKTLGTRTSINLGFRLEHTKAEGITIKQTVNNRYSYTNLFPSLSIEHELTNGNSISLSAGRRIDRPSYADLNPVRWYNDQYFMYAGNPYLRPELAWIFSTSYNFRNRYVLTAAYRRHTDFLSRRLIMEEGTNAIISQRTNFGKMNRIDISASTPFKPANNWTIQLSTTLTYTSYPIGQLNGAKTLSQYAANIQLMQEFNLPLGISSEVACYWYSSELWGIYRKKGLFYTDAGLKKEFFRRKVNVRVAVTDIFRTNIYRAFSLSDDTDYYFRERPDTRRASLTITYHIGGKTSANKPRRIEEQDRL